jgi:TolB-like protein
MEPGAAMTEQVQTTVEPPEGLVETSEQLEKKRKKKKDKVRSAWISFVGRIVAQILGAVATISLGLMVVQKYSPLGSGAVEGARAETTQATTVPARLVTRGDVSLAVLPLENFSADPREYFADAMTEALIADVSKVPGLRVLSRTSCMRYKGHGKTIPEIGRELNVDLIVEGSVAKVDNRVRITVQLIDSRSDEHIWAESYERALGNELALQAEVAAAVARGVKIAINPTGQRISRLDAPAFRKPL